MKETRLTIRIDTDLKQLFAIYCAKSGSTPSDELRRLITKLLAEDAK